ncbi:MAG: molybdate ABC transporter substrate-binding protein [Armatimonadetes bacterium]|nr:molybdate ABC transporter substrate-binding protein [Armatimonadota bacterium]
MRQRQRFTAVLVAATVAALAAFQAQAKPRPLKLAAPVKNEGWRVLCGSSKAKVLVEAFYPINAAGGEGHEWVIEYASQLVAAYPNQVRAIVYDFASAKGGAEWQKHNLSCGAFVIGGKVQATLKGKKVTYMRTPALSGWTLAQLKASVGEEVKRVYAKKASGTAAPAKKSAAGASSGGAIISVAVPCGLAGPYGDLVRLFHARSKNVRVSPRVNGVVALLKQFRDGVYPQQPGPPEIYLALGTSELADLKQRGRLVDGNVVKCARIPLALIVHKRNPARVQDLNDLTSSAVKAIAIYSYDLSGGRGAKQVLQRARLWEMVSKKTVTPSVPDQAKQMVKQGRVQAAIIYRTCLMESYLPNQPAVRETDLKAIDLYEDLYEPIHVGAVLIKGAPHTEAAREFLAFLETPEARKVWTKWGFLPPV